MDVMDIKGVEIFATGTWNGDEYTDKDLDVIVGAFDETKEALKPYIKLGHTDKQELAQADGMPAIGWIDRIYKIGDKLVADFVKVPKKIFELIQTGAYRRVSSEIFINLKLGEKMFPKALKAVSLLGSDTPAVQNLNDIMALYDMSAVLKAYSEIECKSYEYEADKKNINEEDGNMEIEELKVKQEELQKKFDEAVQKNEELAKAADASKVDAEAKQKELEEANKQKDEAKAEIAKNALESKRKEIEVKVDKYISDPKTFALPVDKDVLCKLIEHCEFSEEKKYKIGDEEKTVANMLNDLLTRERVELNTDNKSHVGTTEDIDNSALYNKAVKYAKENNVSYSDALISVSK